MKTLRKFLILGLAIILLFALNALTARPMQVAAAPEPSVDWYFIGGTGSSLISGDLSLDSTLGQPISGMPNQNLCTGFTCSLGFWWQLQMPLIIR